MRAERVCGEPAAAAVVAGAAEPPLSPAVGGASRAGTAPGTSTRAHVRSARSSAHASAYAVPSAPAPPKMTSRSRPPPGPPPPPGAQTAEWPWRGLGPAGPGAPGSHILCHTPKVGSRRQAAPDTRRPPPPYRTRPCRPHAVRVCPATAGGEARPPGGGGSARHAPSAGRNSCVVFRKARPWRPPYTKMAGPDDAAAAPKTGPGPPREDEEGAPDEPRRPRLQPPPFPLVGTARHAPAAGSYAATSSKTAAPTPPMTYSLPSRAAAA